MMEGRPNPRSPETGVWCYTTIEISAHGGAQAQEEISKDTETYSIYTG